MAPVGPRKPDEGRKLSPAADFFPDEQRETAQNWGLSVIRHDQKVFASIGAI